VLTTTHPRIGPAMIHPGESSSNRLLAALTGAEWERWRPRLESLDLRAGQVLYESGMTQSHVYFPTSAIVSLLHVTRTGAMAEIALVGNEGIVGVPLFLGGGFSAGRGVVISAGRGFRIGAQTVTDEFNRAGPAMHLLLHYTQALITQTAQTAACNRHHGLDRQLCRWLLLCLDRLQDSEVRVTQELMARVLGVRRESVNKAAHDLQAAGVIDYARGHISVLDRHGLEQRACECYAVVSGGNTSGYCQENGRRDPSAQACARCQHGLTVKAPPSNLQAPPDRAMPPGTRVERAASGDAPYHRSRHVDALLTEQPVTASRSVEYRSASSTW
jgi:CRP-like cAMP-binding protein